MNLWVDDLRDPKDFRPGEDYHWVKNNTEAIRSIATMVGYIDKIAIDHDICHQIPVTLFKGYFVDASEEKYIHQALEQTLEGINHEYACCETFEPTVRYLALWAEVYHITKMPIEIITSNTTKVDLYKEILQSTGDRFDITVNFGGKI